MDHSEHGMHSMHDHGGHNMHETATTMASDMADAVLRTVVGTEAAGAHDAHAGHVSSGVHTMMSMTFHGGHTETVLFDWWEFTSVGGLIGSMLALFLVAVCYEGLKYYRESLFWKTYHALQYRPVQRPEDKEAPEEQPRVVQPSMCSKIHAWQTLLHGVQVAVSYMLMLVFMTYNSWLCVAVVAGAACGNFLFGWRKSVVVDVTEHCH